MRHPLIKLLHLSNLPQMLNDHRMVDTEFFSNFSCCCKRISFDDSLSWSLSASDGWPLYSSSSRLLSPLQNFLNHHYTVCSLEIPGPDALLMLCYLHSFTIHFELEEENRSNLLFVCHHFPNLK